MSRFFRLGANARGIVLMICAMFLFSILDACAKEVAQRTDTVMAIWARYAGQTVVVLALVAPRMKAVMKTRYPVLQLLRSVFLLIATSCFFFGLVLIGLGNAAAIMGINPVLITLGAALILRERFGPRRSLGVGVALIGALIVIRPGSDVFSPFAILPLLAALSYSAYALTTRFVGRDESAWTSLLYAAAFGVILLTVVVPFFWVPPDPVAILLMCSLGFTGGLGHFCVIRAFMVAEAGTVVPFAYCGPIFAITWGMLIFNEFPDSLTYVGALVIISAGIYVWHRETRVAQPAAAE